MADYPDYIVNKVIEQKQGLSYEDARELIRYMDDIVDSQVNVISFTKNPIVGILSRTEFELAHFIRTKSPEFVHLQTLMSLQENLSMKEEVGPINLIRVNISRIKTKLKPYNIVLNNRYKFGYAMPKESAENWDALITAVDS